MLIDMIGDRLKELRIAAGMNQPEFAAIVGTTKQYVSQLESGKNRKPNGEFMEGWARHFKVSLRWLVSGTGPKYAGTATDGAPRLDRAIVAAVAQSLHDTYDREHLTYNFTEEWELFVDLYDAAVQGELRSTGGDVKIGRWLERKAQQGLSGDKGRAGVPTPGTDTRNKRVQREA